MINTPTPENAVLVFSTRKKRKRKSKSVFDNAALKQQIKYLEENPDKQVHSLEEQFNVINKKP